MNKSFKNGFIKPFILLGLLAYFGVLTPSKSFAISRKKSACEQNAFSANVLAKAPDVVHAYEKWHPRYVNPIARVSRIIVESIAKSIPDRLIPFPKKQVFTPALFESQLKKIAISDVFLNDLNDVFASANSYSDISKHYYEKLGVEGEQKLNELMDHYQLSMTELFKVYLLVKASGYGLDANKIAHLIPEVNYKLKLITSKY